MKHTLIMLVDDEFGAWTDVGAALVEGILAEKVQLVPRMTLEQKVEFAERIFGDMAEEPETHEQSVTISDGDITVLQFFDIETTSLDKAEVALISDIEDADV